MVFSPKCRNTIVCDSFSAFKLDDRLLQLVTEFKYLGHIFRDTAVDDEDIKKEIRNMFIGTNILIRDCNLYQAFSHFALSAWRTPKLRLH